MGCRFLDVTAFLTLKNILVCPLLYSTIDLCKTLKLIVENFSCASPNYFNSDSPLSRAQEIKEHLIHKRRMEAHIKALEEWVPSTNFTETDFETQINDKPE